MSKDSNFHHIPVLYEACLTGLAIRPDGIYVDCTTGGAGHSSGILAALGEGGRLICLDRDPMALEAAAAKLEKVQSQASYKLVQANFADLDRVLAAEGIAAVDGVLADLGVSSAQLDQAERGFAYMKDGPLDMRMDPTSGLSAAEWLRQVDEGELQRVLRDYGEERYAGRIAAAICRARTETPLTSSLQLAELIARAMPPAARREKQHPAKRSFQAIRIAINGELDALESLLAILPGILNKGGRACLISFHSLEDRLIKRAFKSWEDRCTCPPKLPICQCGRRPYGQRISKQGIVADAREQVENPRARSARLRIFESNGEALQEKEQARS